MNTSQFFDSYYRNAEVNSILIMETDGTVVDVNQSFTRNFGYNNEDIKGRHFRLLFSERDNAKNRPLLELELALAGGQSDDENYLIHKMGYAIWCTGECLLVADPNGHAYIVKDIINLQAKKQLHLFLAETEELLERIFEFSNDVPILVLDGSLKIERVNDAFLQLFDIVHAPDVGDRFTDLGHPFWTDAGIKKDITRIIVANEPLKHKEYTLETKAGKKRTIRLDSRLIDSKMSFGRRVFIIAEDVTVYNATATPQGDV